LAINIHVNLAVKNPNYAAKGTHVFGNKNPHNAAKETHIFGNKNSHNAAKETIHLAIKIHIKQQKKPYI
jgi:hypothetical protein